MSMAIGRKPRLLTPDLERFIEASLTRARAEDRETARIEEAVRRAWASAGGRAFARFVETRAAEATRRTYRLHIEDFVRWTVLHAGGIDLLDLTPEDLTRYEQFVAERVSPQTGRRMALRSRQERVRTVRTAYAFCVDEELLAKSPARLIRIRGRAEPARTFLSDRDAAALLAACPDSPAGVRDHTLMTLLLHTGLRASEAASLTWNAISESPHPSITVEGKGRVVRTVPASAELLRALDRWTEASGFERTGTAFVLTRLNHRVAGDADRDRRAGTWFATREPLSPDAIHAIVTRRAAKARIARTTPHTLRRTFATKLRDLGIAIDTISRYLGHASITTTVGYFKPDDAGAARKLRALTFDGHGAAIEVDGAE